MASSARWGEAANPAKGVPLYYYLGEDLEEALSIEILDSDGNMVRSYSSKEGDFERCKISNMDPRLPFKLKYPEAKKKRGHPAKHSINGEKRKMLFC